MHISEAEAAALIEVRRAFVVNAEQSQLEIG